MDRTLYRPDIDGLRAISVGLVVLEHAGLAFPGGFIGVDVFFVISGFLITRLIFIAINEKIFSLKEFWLRRLRRILPAAALAVAATLAAGMLILRPSELTSLAESAVAQQLLSANFFYWHNTGYFDLPSRLKPLLHTWSLAVEEQFYLVWPLVLLVFSETITFGINRGDLHFGHWLFSLECLGDDRSTLLRILLDPTPRLGIRHWRGSRFFAGSRGESIAKHTIAGCRRPPSHLGACYNVFKFH